MILGPTTLARVANYLAKGLGLSELRAWAVSL